MTHGFLLLEKNRFDSNYLKNANDEFGLGGLYWAKGYRENLIIIRSVAGLALFVSVLCAPTRFPDPADRVHRDPYAEKKTCIFFLGLE